MNLKKEVHNPSENMQNDSIDSRLDQEQDHGAGEDQEESLVQINTGQVKEEDPPQAAEPGRPSSGPKIYRRLMIK